jgi:general secretion pathway protein E
MSAKPSAVRKDHKLELAQLLDWLEADGVASRERTGMLRELDKRGSYHGKHPLSVIAERGWVDGRDPNRVLNHDVLGQWLATRVELPFLRIDPLRVEVAKVTAVMSYAYAARWNILPVEVKGDSIVVATAEPFESGWEKELAPIAKKRFTRVIANPEDIKRYLVEFYSIAKSVIGAERDSGPGAEHKGKVGNLEQLIELGRSGKLDANDQHVVSIVDWLLQYAYDQRASDIHLEPRREQGVIRFRIDGVMHQVYQLPAPVMLPITSRLKILGRMDIAEKRRPQDGRIKTRAPDGTEIELRMSTMPTAFGEKLVMRIFDPTVLLKGFHELGFDAEDEATWTHMIEEPHGIILVTGPTGSGKTTTLYSTLRQLATPEVNVCTIEDPIELVEPAFNQMQVQAGIGLDFAAGVRTLLRQDPDIIMVGEIRDAETADMAVQAALTGHLVLSTLHTNDAPSSVTRLADLGVQPFLIQSALLGVIAQRLVRMLCPSCKKEAALDDAAWDALITPFKARKPKQAFEAVGCLECRGTGYRGRVGLYEMMTLTPALRGHLGSDPNALRRAALADGMKPLRLRGAQKVAAGVTTVAEVLRVAPAVDGR